MEDYYKEIYTENKMSGNIVIEVSLEKYIEFFHEWDNTRFRKRDINRDLVQFLEECSNEIPLNRSIELRFSVDEKKNDLIEEKIKSSFEHYYKIQALILGGVLNKMYRKIAFGVVLAILLLISAHKIEGLAIENLLSFMVVEGFYIGGWVFLWEAIYALGFERQDEKKKLKEARRFLKSKIDYIYSKC